MKSRMVVCAAFVVLSGCAATITSLPLQPGGSKDASQEPGIRYYLPKPYLLVTELPVAPIAASQNPTTTTTTKTPMVRAAPAPGGTDDSKKTQTDNTQQPQSATPTAPSSDTSFSAAMASYAVKLVYLPDYSHPMALQVKSGWFGTTTLAPTLTDGWMLASLNGSVDSGTANTISALSGLVSGGGGGGGGKSGGSKGGDSSADIAAAMESFRGLDRVKSAKVKLTKKFYLMDDTELTALTDAIVKGEQAAPTPEDIGYAADHSLGDKVDDFMKALLTSALKSKKNSVSWGANVLPPGLYDFAFAEAESCNLVATDPRLDAKAKALLGAACTAKKQMCPSSDTKKCEDTRMVGGELLGLRPVMYFCAEGPVSPRSAGTQTQAGTYKAFNLDPNVSLPKDYPFGIDPTPCAHR
jgi:hypothetical protein